MPLGILFRWIVFVAGILQDMFVDRVCIEAVAGKGGDGCMSFRRERFVPKGGPDGGDGGNGGDVVIIARDGVNSLVNLNRRKQWKADRGIHGSGSKRHGKSGSDEVIYVPPGTVVIDAKRNYVIKDLENPGDSVIAARGGKGGKGNTRFKSATNQAPRNWTPGTNGEIRDLILELKVIAECRAGRKTECRKKYTFESHFKCATGNRRLPIYDEVPKSWNGRS